MSDAAESASPGTSRVPAAGASASRPRPQYGEYATPEEQRARIRQPDVTRALETGQSSASSAAPAASAGVAPAPAARVRPPRFADRVATVALLAYGLFNVLSSFPAFLDYGAYADTMFSLLGVDAELTDPAAGRPWGIAAALILAAGWMGTALLSWWSLRRGRLTWWIPLVAGVVFTFIAGMLMVVPLMSDPGVWQAVTDSVR